MTVGPTWNVVDDVRELLSFHFMLNAVRAGTIVAVVAGVIGYFVVLRRQSFAGHALAVVGFPGAAGATLLGISPIFGLVGFCVAAALVLAALPGEERAADLGRISRESALVGTIQSFALACGFLFVSLYRGFLTGINSLLFGSITGISDMQVLVLLITAGPCLLVLAVVGRPLLFSSIDPGVAAARGVPGRGLGFVFLLVLAVAAAGASQITGSLLVFALLVVPAATAARLTARPARGLVFSVAIALIVTWLGEAIAFYSPYPIGFWVSTLAFGAYVLASCYRATADRIGRMRLGQGRAAA